VQVILSDSLADAFARARVQTLTHVQNSDAATQP